MLAALNPELWAPDTTRKHNYTNEIFKGLLWLREVTIIAYWSMEVLTLNQGLLVILWSLGLSMDPWQISIVPLPAWLPTMCSVYIHHPHIPTHAYTHTHRHVVKRKLSGITKVRKLERLGYLYIPSSIPHFSSADNVSVFLLTHTLLCL